MKQEEEKEADGGQERARTAGTLGIIVLGSGLGLQLMYAAFSLFGEKKIQTADLELFSRWGQVLYLPERELPLYLNGCLVALLLVLWLHRAWRKQLNLLLPSEQAVFALASGMVCLLLALVDTFCFFGLIFVERRILHSLPLSLAATLLFLALETMVFTNVLKRSRSDFSYFTTQAQRWIAGQFADVNSAPTTAIAQGSRNNRFWDLLVPATLFVLIWVPNAHHQAGYVYVVDHFHHWDFFAMAPAVGYMHGGALGTQIYSQYGVGWPVLFATLAPLLPLSYGNMIFVGMAYALLYNLGIYACLRYLFRDGKWAAGGVFFTFLLMFYIGDINNYLWTTPSSMCLRSPCDIWLFFALLLHVRTQRASALYLASALTGLALLFETDTGVYLSVAFGMYLLYNLVLPGENQQEGRSGGNRKLWWRTCTLCSGIVLALLLSGLWIASRGTLFQFGFWAGWLEVFWMYPSGIGMLPIFSSWLGVCLSFLFVGVYVGVGAWALIGRQTRQATTHGGWLLSISVFGMLYMLQYIGRSAPFTPLHLSLPFSLLAIVGIKTFADTFLSSLSRRSDAQGGEPNTLPRPLYLWGGALLGMLLLGMLLLGITPRILPVFRRYPSLIVAFIYPSPSTPQTLLPVTHDVLLPEQYADEVQQFVQTAQEIHALTAQGRRVAILSNDDTALYLASGTPLWGRYSPVLLSNITHVQQAQTASRLAAPGTDYVYILQQNPVLYTTDTWNCLRDVLAAHYKRDHVIGKYEVWRK